MNHKTDVHLDGTATNSTTNVDMGIADVRLDNSALGVDCQSSSRQITDYFAGELSASASEQLMAHLEECAICRKEFEEFDEIWSLTGEVLTEDNIIDGLSADHKAFIVKAQSQEGKTKQKSPIFIRRVIEYSAVAAILLIFAGILLPNFNRARDKGQRNVYVVKNEVKSIELEDAVDRGEVRAPYTLSQRKQGKQRKQVSQNIKQQMNQKQLLFNSNSLEGGRAKSSKKIMLRKRLNQPPPVSIKADKIMSDSLKLNKVSCEVKAKPCPISTFSTDTNRIADLQTKELSIDSQHFDPMKFSETEFINYFDYHYRLPKKTIFGVHLEVAPAPFNQERVLLRIGVQSKMLNSRTAASSHTIPFNARARVVARELQIQVNFNAAAVTRYNKIGYRHCKFSKTDLHKNIINVGEVSSGEAVTVLYEMKLNSKLPIKTILTNVRLRYKTIDSSKVIEDEFIITLNEVKQSFAVATPSFKLAALVAQFAETLHYPERSGVVASSAIAKKLTPLFQHNFNNDDKVAKLLLLMKK
jgi:anti-sigma factor RsiW